MTSIHKDAGQLRKIAKTIADGWTGTRITGRREWMKLKDAPTAGANENTAESEAYIPRFGGKFTAFLGAGLTGKRR